MKNSENHQTEVCQQALSLLSACKSDAEVNRNTKLVSALNHSGLCIINEKVEKVFFVAEKDAFHKNTQKFGLAVIHIKTIVEKLSGFSILRIFLMILNTFLKCQSQKKFWMLHYITCYIYISRYNPTPSLKIK